MTLVRDPFTGNLFALKAVRKDLVVYTRQQKQIAAELKIMRKMNNPFIVNLNRTYKDKFRVYFLMDVAMGGDLFHYMRAHPNLTEKDIMFYAACVVEALQHIHSKQVIYRDMKPENLVITSSLVF